MGLKNNKTKSIRIGIHVIFWLFAWLFFVFYYYRYDILNPITLLASIFNLLVAAITVYTFNYYLIPKFLLKNKTWKFILFAGIALLFFIYLQLLLTVILLIKLLFAEQRLFPQMIDVLMLFVNLFFIVMLAVSVKFYKRWTEKEHRAQVVEKEKVKAELEMLKTQINPHFLFNTLNSIYALALKNSKQTAETVLKLSDILDYILYRVNSPKIPIGQELDILINYIELEKIRYTHRVEVSTIIDIYDKNTPIPPMLIIPFVENAFKHGVGKSMSKSWIKIELTETGERIFIKIENSKPNNNAGQQTTGIGLKNTTQRLNLIYGNNYKFLKTDANHKFQVLLEIPKKTEL